MAHTVSVEVELLVAAVGVGIVQLLWASFAARAQQGYAWGAGARDEPRPATGVAGRLERAFANFMETFPFFAAALLAAVFSGKAGALTVWGAALYVVGRAFYVPLYAAGIAYVRTLVWHVAMTGLAMIVAALFV